MSSSDTSGASSIFELHFSNFFGDDSSVEIPREDWSSLELDVGYYNEKRDLAFQGLYDPGSGDVCAKYITVSDSEVYRHVYYNYPPVKDPGILNALEEPQPEVTYADDGRELYLAVCKEMNISPIRMFYRSLLCKKINLKYYGIQVKGFRAIAIALSRNTAVTVLDLTDNWIPHDGCLHLGEMLKRNETITEMNLSGCRIGPRGAQILAHFLPFNRTLSKLNLSGNEIEDSGIAFLSRAIIRGSRIVHINLSRNKLTAKAVLSLSNAFDANNNVTHLNLSWNTIISPKAVFALCNVLAENKHFTELDLSWNTMSGARIGHAIQALLSSHKITRIILNHNKLWGAAIRSIGLGLGKAKKLETLDLSFNPLTSKDALYLLLRLKDRQVRLKNLLLDNVTVNTEFVETRKKILDLKYRNKTIVTCGYVNNAFTPMHSDIRPLLLRRAEVLGKLPRKKKDRVDAALVFMQMFKMHPEPMNLKEFNHAAMALGLRLGDDFIDEMYVAFPGPRAGLIRFVDMAKLVEFVKRLYPDRQLPPTPQPVTPSEPAAPPSKARKK